MSPVRVGFHDRDDATVVASRLHADGFEADLVRDRFAGEDDDEDHAWAVLTDAPAFLVEVHADAYDGWVEHLDVPEDRGPSGHGEVGEPAPPPLDLPDAPRRVKGHFRGQ